MKIVKDLQWGRAQMSAEITPRHSTPDTCREPFNGAALR